MANIPFDHDSREFYSAVLDCMPNLVFIKDTSLRFVYANEALANILGTTKEAIIGKSDSDFISDEDQLAHFRNADRTVLMTHEPMTISEEFLTDPARGLHHRLATLKVPFRWPTNDNVCVLGLATDITAIPAGRTQADTMRLAIISDLAHVIRSPIATALFNLDAMAKELEKGALNSYPSYPWLPWLRRSYRKERLRTNIEFIRKALLGIHVTSRTFAAIAQSLGQQNKEDGGPTESTPLIPLIGEAITSIEQIMPSALLTFTHSKSADGLRVSLRTPDISLVKTALFNIVHNAIKFSLSNKSIVIQLEVGTNEATLCVKDQGSGITSQDLPRVFDPGFTRRAPGHSAGTGMGLTVAKETFDRLGWTITLSSRPKIGTEVRVVIPRHHL